MKELTEKQPSQTTVYLNAAIQLGAILLYQHLALVWPLYIVMAMLAILVVAQTFAASLTFARIFTLEKSTSKTNSYGIGILISLIYMVSCYHVYMIGFVGFAWLSFAHVLIQLFANIFGAMK